MVDYYKRPKLEIPSWLSLELDQATFYVMGEEIRVGAVVRKPLDWLVGILNTLVDGLNTNFTDLYDKHNTLSGQLGVVTRGVYGEISDLQAKYLELKGFAADIVIASKDIIAAWIDERLLPTKNLVLVLQERVQWLSGEAATKEPPWWRPDQILEAITKGIGNIIYPGGETEEDAKNLFQWLWLFFRDPPKFLYEMAEEMIVRFL